MKYSELIAVPPLAMKEEAAILYVGSRKILTELIAVHGLKPLTNEHKHKVYDRASLDLAYLKYKAAKTLSGSQSALAGA